MKRRASCHPQINSRKRKVGGERSSTYSLPAEDVSLLEVRPKTRKIDQAVAPEKITRILLSNVRSIRQPANYGHLCMQIENIQPDAVALNETWLAESTGELAIPGMKSTARFDRNSRTKTCGGGIDLYCKKRTTPSCPLSTQRTCRKNLVDLAL